MSPIIPADKKYPTPSPIPTVGGLAGKVSATLALAFTTVRDMCTEWLEDRLVNFLVRIFTAFETELSPMISPIIDIVDSVGATPPGFRKLFDELKHPTGQMAGNVLSGLASQTAGSGLSAVLNAFFRMWGYAANEQWDTQLLTPDAYTILAMRNPENIDIYRRFLHMLGYNETQMDFMKDLTRNYAQPNIIAQLMIRGDVTDPAGREYIKKMGYKDDDVDAFLKSARMLLDVDSVRTAYLRGEIIEAEHDERLVQLGIKAADIALLKKLYFFIPPVQDLVRMAVREAFDPKSIEFLQLDKDFPPAFGEWARKQGVSDTWAHHYWQAHWELPSVQMGFEMMHRNQISPDEMRALLKALDFSPAWRDKLMNISYNTYTRVDTRRMYQIGVLTPDEVLKSYLDQGYDADHAQHLKEFTILGATTQEKDLSRGDIIASYKDKLIGREEAKQFIENIGYDMNEAELYLARADYELEKADRSDKIELVHQRYINHACSQQQAIDDLLRIPVSGTELEMLIRKWEPQATTKNQALTKEDIHSLYVNGIYDRHNTVTTLQGIGYTDFTADTICMVWDAELAKAEAAKKVVKVRVPSVSEIRQMWEQDVITTDQARDYLGDNNYLSESIEYLIQMWDKVRRAREKAEADALAAKMTKTPKQLTRGDIGDLYRAAVINEFEARSLLAGVNYVQSDIDISITRWNLQIAERQALDLAAAQKAETVIPRLLTRSQVGELYIATLITEDTARELLNQLHYYQEDIDSTIALWNTKVKVA